MTCQPETGDDHPLGFVPLHDGSFLLQFFLHRACDSCGSTLILHLNETSWVELHEFFHTMHIIQGFYTQAPDSVLTKIIPGYRSLERSMVQQNFPAKQMRDLWDSSARSGKRWTISTVRSRGKTHKRGVFDSPYNSENRCCPHWSATKVPCPCLN